VKEQGKLNTHIIFERVLIPFIEIIKISLCLPKLQLAEVGVFVLRNSVESNDVSNIEIAIRSLHLLVFDASNVAFFYTNKISSCLMLCLLY